jgi:hypothetical protein
MWKFKVPLVLAAILALTLFAGVFNSKLQANAWVSVPGMSNGLLGESSDFVVVGDKKKSKGKKKKTGNICKGEIACPPGYVVLDKPNAYGACCEQKQGLPAPAPAEAEKCKFPGEVGTPPNCHCPEGTEFMGYRGCLAKEVEVGPAPKHIPRVMGCSTWDAENAAAGAHEFNCNFGKTQCQQLANGGAKCCCICAAPGVDGCP